MAKHKVDKYYKKKARELTDLLFDKGFLNDNLSRESIRWLEDYIGFILEWNCDFAVTAAVLTANMRIKSAKLNEK